MNFILHFPVEELVAVCLEEQVPVLSFYWGARSLCRAGPRSRLHGAVPGRVGRGSAAIGEASFAGQRVPVQRFMSLPPMAEATGDIESMAMLAGQGLGLVGEIQPASEIVRELVEGARRIIEQRLGGVLTGARS